MTRLAIVSSAIAEVGFDDATSTLEIKFHPNKKGIAAVWQYAPVHRSIYEAMIDPEQSAGRLYSTVQRDPNVVATRIEEDVEPNELTVAIKFESNAPEIMEQLAQTLRAASA